MDNIDLWRAARSLIREYGGNAAFHAAQRFEVLREEGDTASALAWLRITRIIYQLKVEKADDAALL